MILQSWRRVAARRIGRRTVATVAVCSMGILAAGCGSSSPGASSSGGSASGGSSQKPVNVALVTGLASLAFYTSMNCGAKAAAHDLGNVNLTVAGPSQYSLPQQVQVLEGVLATHRDGLLLVPVDPNGLNATVQRLMTSNTPVITLDGYLSQKLEVANIRGNNYQGGVLGADALGKAIGGKGDVARLALSPSAPFNADRVRGFSDEMQKKFPGITLLPVQYDQGATQKSASNAAAIIQAHPNLAGIFGAQQTAGEGALSAVQAAGKVGRIKIVGYDADPSEITPLLQGGYTALIAQSPYTEGYNGLTELVKLIRQETSRSKIPYQQYAPLSVLTKDNVNNPSEKKFVYLSQC